MSELSPKTTADKKLQLQHASLVHDDPDYFGMSERRLSQPQSRLEGLELWDEYVDAVRQIRKGRHYADSLGAFLEREEATPGPLQLVEAQREVVESIQNSLETGLLHSTIVMPTGAGKTAIFAKVADTLNLRTLIVTPSKIGVEQIQGTFDEFREGELVGAVYQHEKNFDKTITVTTYDSLRRNLARGSMAEEATARDAFYPEDYDLVIFDEAHLSLTEDRKAAARLFQNCVRLAFTATPVYSEEKGVEAVFGQIIHKMTIEEAVVGGLLAEKISASVVRTNIDLSDIPLNSTGEYNETQLVKKINTPVRNNAAVDVYNEHFFGEQAIIRCVTIEHAQAVQQTFEERFKSEGVDLKVAVVHGDMDPRQINEILEGVKNGTIDIVCSAKLLDFAFDAPGVSVAFNLAPTLSRVTEEQFGGRVIRKDRLTGRQKHARIVDFLDNDIHSERTPIIYAQILGVPSITSPQYIEPKIMAASPTGTITGTQGSIWAYISNFEDVDALIKQLEARLDIDTSYFITLSDMLRSLPGERRLTLVRQIADGLRINAYKSLKIPLKIIPSTLYPPMVLDKLQQVLERDYRIAPEDWVTETTFAPLVRRKWQTFGSYIDNDLANHPERQQWVGVYANKRGRSRYLSPEYQEALSKELDRKPQVQPAGYSTVGYRVLQESTGIPSVGTLLQDINELIAANKRPDWVIKGFWNGQHVVNLFADELRDLLIKKGAERQAIPQARSGSVTKEDLGKRLNDAYHAAFSEWFDTYTKQHPEDSAVGIRRGTQGNVTVYVDAERADSLIEEFRISLRGEINLPEGYIVMEGLIKQIQTVRPELKEGAVRQAVSRWLADERNKHWLDENNITLQQYRYSLTRKPATGFPPMVVAKIMEAMTRTAKKDR